MANVWRKRIAEARDQPEPEGGWGKVKSSYYEQASKLSGKSGEKGYWARPTELLARAFEAYVFDRIKAGDRASQYLVQGVEADRYATGYRGNPYPVGLKREAINAAFDKLFQTMQVRESGGGKPALYSRFGVGQRGPRDFVPAPDGSLDFGQIDAEMARVIGRTTAAIRLQEGQHDPKTGRGFGRVHIEEQRGDAIRAAGYADTARRGL